MWQSESLRSGSSELGILLRFDKQREGTRVATFCSAFRKLVSKPLILSSYLK